MENEFWAILPKDGDKPELRVKIKFANQGAHVSPMNFKKRTAQNSDLENVRAYIETPDGQYSRPRLGHCHEISAVVAVDKNSPATEKCKIASQALCEELGRRLEVSVSFFVRTKAERTSPKMRSVKQNYANIGK